MAVSLAVIIGIGFVGDQLYQTGNQHYQNIEARQAQLALQVSDLNDRLIAVTRETKTPTAPIDTKNNPDTMSAVYAHALPQHWLRQTVQLAQSQLDQATVLSSPQQLKAQNNDAYSAAKETLDQVKQALPSLVEGKAISEITAAALIKAIDTDLNMINENGQKQIQANQILDRNIAQLQQQLDRMARQGPRLHVTTPPAENGQKSNQTAPVERSFLERISQLVVIEEPTTDVRAAMLQRGLLCREAALTLSLARLALAQGQSERVMQLLADSNAQLGSLVDADARQVQATLASLNVAQHVKLQLSAFQWLPPEPQLKAPMQQPQAASSPQVVAS